MNDLEIKKAFSEIEALFKKINDNLAGMLLAEYRRGEQDAISRIVKAAQGAEIADVTTNGAADEQPKEHAPRGTARSLIDRVLAERGPRGASPSEIMEAAIGLEKLASFSGIRFALANGRDEHRYRNKDGKWFRVVPRVRLDEAELPRGDSR